MELKLVVPTSLDEITLEQYQRFARIEGEGEFKQMKMLEIFCGVPFSDLPNVRLVDAVNVLQQLTKTLSEKPGLTKFFELNEVKYGFIPALNEISLGEFVDLDSYLSDWATMHRAMAVLYRPVVKEKGERYDIEKYEATDERDELMKQMPASVVLGALVFFLSFRERIGSAYPALFGERTENPYTREAQFGQRWGWYQSIYALAQGDVLKFGDVTKLPINQALTYLTFEKEKNDIEISMIKK